MEAMDHSEQNGPQIAYTLQQLNPDQEFYMLHAAGHACICPFYPVIPQQDEDGNTVMSRTGCNTQCPLAKLEMHRRQEGPGEPAKIEYWFTTYCGGVPLERRVEIRKASKLTAVPMIVHPSN